MPLPFEKLGEIVADTVRHLANAETDLLVKNQIAIHIDEVQFQVNCVAQPNGLFLRNVTSIPKRVTTSETPETIEESTQDTDAVGSSTEESSTQESKSTKLSEADQTTFHGRETKSENGFKD